MDRTESHPCLEGPEGFKPRIMAMVAASRRFSMRDLIEEFVTTGIWPLATGSSFSVAPPPPPVSRELVTTEDDGSTNFHKEGFVWSFLGEFTLWEFLPL